jgi:hypothetical protein
MRESSISPVFSIGLSAQKVNPACNSLGSAESFGQLLRRTALVIRRFASRLP